MEKIKKLKEKLKIQKKK